MPFRRLSVTLSFGVAGAEIVIINLEMRTILFIVAITFFVAGCEDNRTSKIEGVEWKKTDQDTILVTRGFNYDSNHWVSFPSKLVITKCGDDYLESDTAGARFSPTYVAEKKPSEPWDPNGPFFRISLETHTMNVRWFFLNPRMSFVVGYARYTSTSSNATVEFTKDGVVLKGFSVKAQKSKR